MNADLTVGKPGRVLLKYCLPLFASVLFQQMYNIADSLVAGRLISNDALAAVGNSYEITLIFIAFGFGINVGCSVVVAQLFGAKDYRNMKTAVTTTFIAGGALCLMLMALGFGFCDALLRLIQTPEIIFADSKLYLMIYILGLPFVFFYNISTGAFAALGDSKTPFWFLACSSVANIGMDILFVAGFGMSVDGVAWATFICQGVSCVLAVVFLFRRLKNIDTDGKSPLLSIRLLKRISRIAVPSILQQSFISVGNIIIQGVINGFGAAAVAGYSASVKLNNMVVTSFTTLGNGVSNFSAQNLGAKKFRRIGEGFSSALVMMLCLCLPWAALYFFAGRPLVALFLENPNGRALTVGVDFLRIVAPFYAVVAAKLVSDGVLRGTGRMNAFMAGTFTDLVLRAALAAILSKTELQTTGIWLAWPIGWIVAAAISLTFYKTSKWDRVTS